MKARTREATQMVNQIIALIIFSNPWKGSRFLVYPMLQGPRMFGDGEIPFPTPDTRGP